MKLRKTTWILLILAIILSGVAYLYTAQDSVQQTAISKNQQQLFNFSREDIEKLLIKTPKTTLEFVVTGNPVTPSWQMKQPQTTPASQAAISFLVDLLVDGQSEKSFNVPANQKKEYGLDNPSAIITITLKNQKTHQLILGKTDFEDKFLYAQVDTLNQPDLQVSLVDKSFQYALERDLAEWKQIP